MFCIPELYQTHASRSGPNRWLSLVTRVCLIVKRIDHLFRHWLLTFDPAVIRFL